jgi:hypothetical protein
MKKKEKTMSECSALLMSFAQTNPMWLLSTTLIGLSVFLFDTPFPQTSTSFVGTQKRTVRGSVAQTILPIGIGRKELKPTLGSNMVGVLGGTVTSESMARFQLTLKVNNLILKEIELIFAEAGTKNWEIEFEAFVQTNNQLVFQGHLDYHLNHTPQRVSLRSSIPFEPTSAIVIDLSGQWVTAGDNTWVTEVIKLEAK